MLKIRRPLGRLIFNMGIAIPGKTVFLIETAPRVSVGMHSIDQGYMEALDANVAKCKWTIYSQTSYISHTDFPNLNFSCLVLQLSLRNLLNSGVELSLKM